jgi:anti-sigma factor RsiW
MKTFEEKWTAWLDDELSGSELAEFEASLPDRAAAEAEKRDARKLGAFLKEQLQTRTMSNEDFFSHQLREQIAREGNETVPEESPVARQPRWSIARLVWTGAASLAIFSVCTYFVLRAPNQGDQSQYLTQVLNARVDTVESPNASISIFETKEDRVTVLWVDGLQSLPSEYATK